MVNQYFKKYQYINIVFLIFFISSCTQSSDAFLIKAKGLMKEKHFDEAITNLNKAIEKDEKNADAFNTRGVANLELGRMQEALMDYNQAIKLNKNSDKPVYNRARYCKCNY